MDATKRITYRVNIAYDTKQVTITSIGMESVDTTVKDNYNSVDELPTWMQDRLAVLSMLEVPPPPNDVAGVGSRIGPYLFWVYN